MPSKCQPADRNAVNQLVGWSRGWDTQDPVQAESRAATYTLDRAGNIVVEATTIQGIEDTTITNTGRCRWKDVHLPDGLPKGNFRYRKWG